MFRVKANSVIQVYAPFGDINRKNGEYGAFDWAPWKAYCTKEDKLYDNHEVIDDVAVYNRRDDVTSWVRSVVEEYNMFVLCVNGKYAMVKPKDLEYLD